MRPSPTAPAGCWSPIRPRPAPAGPRTDAGATIDCVTDDSVEVIPLLACADIEAEHAYLVDVLGFSSGSMERGPDENVVHAEVRAGSRRIWLHRADEGAGLVPPAVSGKSGGGIVVHVPDVDAHHDRVRAGGAEILYEPRDEEYGQREYGVRDPEGHVWWIATPIASDSDT